MSLSADLDPYFARIGYRGAREPTLATLHAITAAHVQAIPFENLDVLLGVPISLEIEALFDKLVHRRRGGYCFEQNGLLLHVLGAMGFEVAPLSARVRIQRPRDFTPARTHLFIRVQVAGETWLTDVGLGRLSLTAAIRLDTDAQQSTPNEPRRIVREGCRMFHQARVGDEWCDVSEFTLEEMPPIDREVANWYTSAHPASHFKDKLVAARAAPAGVRISLLNRELTTRQPDGSVIKRSIRTPDELLVILAQQFGLTFSAATRFGLPGSPWPSDDEPV